MEVVLLSLNMRISKQGTKPYGHRSLSDNIKFSLNSPAEYEDKLLEYHVIANSDKRLESISQQLEKMELENKFIVLKKKKNIQDS